MAGRLSVGKRQTHPEGIGRGNHKPQAGRCGEARKQRIGITAAVNGMKWVNVKGAFQNIVLLLAGSFLLIPPAVAQLRLGETSNTLNGTLSAGYNGDFGNQGMPSDHGLSFGGTGTLSGYYYNPNFLSYGISPYVNQARDNSTYQSISDSSGVNITSSIFAGSKFPGSITYARRSIARATTRFLVWPTIRRRQQRHFRHYMVRDLTGHAQPLCQLSDGK